MNNLQIRDARETDRNTIQSVTLSAYEQYAPLMDGAWEFYRANILATLADVKPAEQIVAETEGSVVGTVLLYPVGTKFQGPDGTQVNLALPEIRLLAVIPTARGQGIGQSLVRECVRRARRSGVTALTLHTTDMMKVAMQMYERMGFARMPALDFSPAPGHLVKGYRIELGKLTV